MKPQAIMLTTLILMAMVLAAQIATAAPQHGRSRKVRGASHVNPLKLIQAQKEKCSLGKNSQHYFQVRMNVTTSEHQLRGDVRTRALNPWTYSIDTDNLRFPTHITQTVCAGHCSGFNLNPIEIKQQIYVLKKDHSGCTFTMETMIIVVGCTCISPDTIMTDS